jgi:hypothetical protein
LNEGGCDRSFNGRGGIRGKEKVGVCGLVAKWGGYGGLSMGSWVSGVDRKIL